MTGLDARGMRGKLFVVEGIDGSGKSTQIDLLYKWLVGLGYLVVFTEWNSSPIVKATTKRGKKRHLLTPMGYSLIHAADFGSRINSQILPALEAGAIVLADRYVYTAFVRDAVRGVDRDWLRGVYSFAVKPTVAFYFDVPLEEAVARILEGRPELKYYEAGLDLGWSGNPEESFYLFQSAIQKEYESLVDEYGLVRMNATQTLVRQQKRMRSLIEPHLDGVVKLSDTTIHDALREAGLIGRYLGERKGRTP